MAMRATAGGRPPTLSGVQRQVLSLYRSLLRTARRLDGNPAPSTGGGAALEAPSAPAPSMAVASASSAAASSAAAASATAAAGVSPTSARALAGRVTAEFRASAASVGRRDYEVIEYLLRQGHKRLELLQGRGVTGVSTVVVGGRRRHRRGVAGVAKQEGVER